jgi:hypothetical protein
MKKFKLKINALDVVIIILALALGLAAYKLLNADRGGGDILAAGKTVKLRYTIELTNLLEGTGGLIKPGDDVMEIVEKHSVGTGAAVEISPYVRNAVDLTQGREILSEIPGREMARLTIDVTLTDTGRELTANGLAIRAGIQLSVTGPGWGGTGYITGIERGEQ